jgi:hypothetical protein
MEISSITSISKHYPSNKSHYQLSHPKSHFFFLVHQDLSWILIPLKLLCISGSKRIIHISTFISPSWFLTSSLHCSLALIYGLDASHLAKWQPCPYPPQICSSVESPTRKSSVPFYNLFRSYTISFFCRNILKVKLVLSNIMWTLSGFSSKYNCFLKHCFPSLTKLHHSLNNEQHQSSTSSAFNYLNSITFTKNNSQFQ